MPKPITIAASPQISRGRKPSQKRQYLLEVAAATFAEKGYPNTEVEDIAQRLGVGKGTVYRCYPSKRELFLAAADHGMQLLMQAIDRAIENVPHPLEQIRRAIEAYLAFFHRHPAYVELLLQERAFFKDRETPTYFVHRKSRIARWRVLYAKLIELGWVRPISPRRITDVVGNLVYGTMFTNYFTKRHRSPRAQADEMVDILFHGLLTRQGVQVWREWRQRRKKEDDS